MLTAVDCGLLNSYFSQSGWKLQPTEQIILT